MFGDRACPCREVPVDGAWWVVNLSLWDLGLNTEEARKMTILILASEDGRKLSMLGLVPAPNCHGLRVIVANGYVLFLACVVVR